MNNHKKFVAVLTDRSVLRVRPVRHLIRMEELQQETFFYSRRACQTAAAPVPKLSSAQLSSAVPCAQESSAQHE